MGCEQRLVRDAKENYHLRRRRISRASVIIAREPRRRESKRARCASIAKRKILRRSRIAKRLSCT